MGTPPAELPITAPVVAALVAAQVPLLAGQPVRIVGEGWDNVVARVGSEWCARLPRRASAVELIRNEQRWLPDLAPSLPLAVPVPWFAGRPGDGYPWPWTLCRWLEGDTAAERPPLDLSEAADQLAEFVDALHQPAPADAPTNPVRGTPLARRADAVSERIERLGDAIDGSAVQACWIDLAATRSYQGPPVWLHGDLHPLNMLTTSGRLTAVIDFGDICAGDPATDLAVAWIMFPSTPRRRLVERIGSDPATVRRAAGWALNLSLAYLTADDSTSLPAIGRTTLARVLADFV